jgi:gas vesicle protein
MEHDEIHDTATFIAGLTIGALIGSAAAILFAPQSGRRTRRQIGRTAEKWGETAQDKAADVRAETKRAAERARRRVDDAGDRLSEVVEQGRDRLRS